VIGLGVKLLDIDERKWIKIIFLNTQNLEATFTISLSFMYTDFNLTGNKIHSS